MPSVPEFPHHQEYTALFALHSTITPDPGPPDILIGNWRSRPDDCCWHRNADTYILNSRVAWYFQVPAPCKDVVYCYLLRP